MAKRQRKPKPLSAADLLRAADHCFATLHTGERIHYQIVCREVKMMTGNGGIAAIPHVTIARRDDAADAAGLYRMDSLFYALPGGVIVGLSGVRLFGT